MTNFIEELYYGNIDPQARGYRPKSPVKKTEGVTEQLKAQDSMEWVRRMNRIKEQIMEALLHELIYA